MSKGSFDPDKFRRDYDSNIDLADDLMRSWADKATKAGYIRDNLKIARPYWMGIASEWESDPVKQELAATGEDFIGTQHQELERILHGEPDSRPRLDAVIGTLTVFVQNTSTASSVVRVAGVEPLRYAPDPLTVQRNEDSYAARLGKLDSALERTYRGIWEALHGTTADPERAALFLMRQAFDHLFDRLAPDDAVRASEFWKPKPGHKKHQVHREERMKYVAHRYVPDPIRAESLRATARNTLAVYDALQRAHERGELDRDKARESLLAMKSFLESWVDAMKL